ncbi:hypothetical protein MBLNU457_1414t1 [Dothideomycetes sp. NU457]
MSSAENKCVDLEEWQDLQDPNSRRRIQNRIAQRVYRRKRKAQRDALKRESNASSVSGATINTYESLDLGRNSRQRSESECSLPSLSDSVSSSSYNGLSPEVYPQPFSETDHCAVNAWASSSTMPTSPPLNQCIGPLSFDHDPSINYPAYIPPDSLPLTMDQTLSIHNFDHLCDPFQAQDDYHFSSGLNCTSSSCPAEIAAFEALHKLTALQSATSAGQGLANNIPLDEGASVEDCTVIGSTALHLAASSGNADTVNLLLDLGANIYVQDFEGRTALHFAAQHDQSETIMHLLHRGIYVDTVDHCGTTALHLAAEQGLENTVRILIESGANVSARDAFGRNAPLHAAGNGHASTIKLLLDAGADMHSATGSP